jgi:HSP20 family protein
MKRRWIAMDEKDERRQAPRRTPMDDLEDFFRQDPFRGILKSIDDFFANHALLPKSFPVRLYETKTEWIVEAELPGVDKGNIHVELLDDRIRIIIESDAAMEAEHKEKGTYSQQRHFERAERIVSLPYAIDRAQTRAAFSNGVLKISGPKFPSTGNTLTIK